MGVYVHLEYESVHEDGLGLVVFEVVETHRQESEQLQRGGGIGSGGGGGGWVRGRREGGWVVGWVP